MIDSPRAVLAAAVEEAARAIGADGELPDLELVRARNPDHGEYASSAGMKLARVLRKSPAQIAAELAAAIRVPGEIAIAETAGGYLNFRLAPDHLRRLVGEIVAAGRDYGRATFGAGERVQVEFGSINPTGPLHIGHGRGIVLGDSLARLLEFTGHQVEREYYLNDFGTQALRFGQSLLARYRGEEPPEGGYRGEYVVEIAEAARAAGVEPTVESLMEFGTARVTEEFKAVMAALDIRYDNWWSEKSLWVEGFGPQALERLQEGGHLRERDGATWFAPAMDDEAADEEERVVIRANGEHTYFASDLGYLLNRFEKRGFDRVIEVWGADHHGYVARMRAGAQALGLDNARLEILLMQMVNLKEGKMSKRAGRYVPFAELIALVGADAVRYFYLTRTPDTTMDFDLELAVSQGRSNPVYYVQYAHARLAGVERAAAGRDLPAEADPALLGLATEFDLIRQLAFWPEVVADAARLREPHRIPYYLYELADRVSTFYEAGNSDGSHRVVVPDPALTRARLELARAARATLRSGLALIGVTAPEAMARTDIADQPEEGD